LTRKRSNAEIAYDVSPLLDTVFVVNVLLNSWDLSPMMSWMGNSTRKRPAILRQV